MPNAALSPYRTVSFWLAAAIAAFQLLNAGRALLSPAAFADYYGVPVADAQGGAWVLVYALRTGFIAIMVAILLAAGQFRALARISLAAVILPIGDFLLAQAEGAPISILARHAAIGVFLVLTAWRLHVTSSRVG